MLQCGDAIPYVPEGNTEDEGKQDRTPVSFRRRILTGRYSVISSGCCLLSFLSLMGYMSSFELVFFFGAFTLSLYRARSGQGIWSLAIHHLRLVMDCFLEIFRLDILFQCIIPFISFRSFVQKVLLICSSCCYYAMIENALSLLGQFLSFYPQVLF